ncbi:MAG: XRE family transcriptional regulator [Betaproteobacteria bacterium]|nr:XRE family transcriptional regulator [Betaproteobacteria bacterium]
MTNKRRSAAGVSADLGARLRAARERAGVTLRGLARRIGVSASLVSQIERGNVTPSVGTLYSIANELDLVLDDLFRAGGTNARARNSRTAATNDGSGLVRKQGKREAIRLAAGVRWERLAALPGDEVEFLYVVYDVGGASCDEDSMIRHGGKEYAYLLSGRLGMKIGFDEYELKAGDSISFDAHRPHRLWTLGRKPAVAVWVVVNRHGDGRVRRESRK